MKVLVTDISWADTAIEDEVLAEVGARTVLAPTGAESGLVELPRDADAIHRAADPAGKRAPRSGSSASARLGAPWHVDRRFLEAMRPTACLLNAARGAIVDHDALADALEEGRIAGAGIDVFEPERLPPEHRLLRQPRLLATPHTAFYSEQSMRDLARLAAENVAAVLAGRRPAALVNPEVLADEETSARA